MNRRDQLSRRERQIVDALFAMGEGGVSEVRERLPDPPGYDAVRTTLRILEEKGAITHREVSGRYVYRVTLDEETTRRNAMEHLAEVFFAGSREQAALAFLRSEDGELEPAAVEELERLIQARRDGR